MAFGTVASEDLLGTVSTVNVKELLKKDYHTNILESTVGSVGGMTTNGNIWGQGPMVLVDGIPRSQYDLRPSEVESITVLKGANAAVLYGSRGAKGVILITTKEER